MLLVLAALVIVLAICIVGCLVHSSIMAVGDCSGIISGLVQLRVTGLVLESHHTGPQEILVHVVDHRL